MTSGAPIPMNFDPGAAILTIIVNNSYIIVVIDYYIILFYDISGK